jgi:hypothetical protein
MKLTHVVRLNVTAAVAMFAALSGTPAHADRLLPLEQRVNVSIGAFLFDTDTRLRVDGTDRDRGTEIDLEDTFGFDDQDRLRIDGYWRFAERHKVRFLYFSSRAESTRTIHEEIEFGDATFPVDAFVRAQLQTDVIELAYEYAFMRRDTFELGGTIGLHNMEVNARLSAGASSTLGVGGIDISEEAKGNGPLPVLGLHAMWAFSDHFYLDAQLQFFLMEIDEYDGSLQDYKISFVWQPSRYIGVGIGYNDFVTRVEVDAERFVGRLRFGYGGPLAFVSVGF